MNLKIKYTLFYLVLTTIILASFSVLVYFQFKGRLENTAQQNLALFLEHEWEHFAAHGEHPRALGLEHEEKDILLQIWQGSRLLFEVRPPGDKKIDHEVTYELEKELAGVSYRLLARQDGTALQLHIRELRRLFILGWALACFILAPLSWIFSNYVLQPFRTLAQKIGQLSAERLNDRFEYPQRQDEFGMLAAQFNDLLSRLEVSFSQTKRFASQASHEFRTPLAIIQSQAQYLLKKDREKSDYREGLSVIHAQGKILQKTVSHLLFLAEIERIQSEPNRIRIDLSAMIADLLVALEKTYGPKEVILTPKPPSSVDFYAQEELFASILNNLCENAFKYGSAKIAIEYQLTEQELIMTIDDDGPGIADEDRNRIFEPLYRGKNTTTSPGSGLGLAMVQSCLKKARGTISFTKSPLGGARATVHLPC